MNEYSTLTVDGDGEQSAETTDTAGRERDGDDSVTHGRPEERTLPLDQTFEILKNQRRRYVLQYLNAAEGPVSLSELAEQIAAWENGKEVRQITSSERKRVYVGLYQCHLPKMDGMDVISFNKPRGIIERGETADCFEPYLQRNDSSGGSWNRYYVSLAVGGIGLLPVAVLLQTQAMVPLVATILFVAVVSCATAFRLAREDGTDSGDLPGS